ncbi:MAG: hypothetical protein PHH14_01085 [Candidatus Margulisbacteria bacterium]|nr:hypothetical protein [Candidatus Margulisiibacteriota bacterium]
MKQAKYNKAEIIRRVILVNNFRLVFGLCFFVGLLLLNISRISINVPTATLFFLGFFILFYALLTYYFLKTQQVSLTEIMYLSVFLGILDLLLITTFVYFSGGIESPYFVFYMLILSSVPVKIPYFSKSVFLWAGAASVFYDLMIYFTVVGLIPFYSRSSGVVDIGIADIRLNIINALLIPAVLFFFSAGIYLIAQIMASERLEIEEERNKERDLEKKITEFSSLFWILTHVFNVEKLMEKSLDKILELLGIRSGMIMLADKDGQLFCQAKREIDRSILETLEGKTIKQLPVAPSNLKAIILSDAIIHHISVRKLVFNHKIIGALILFGKEGEDWLEPTVSSCLDAATSEIAAAVYYNRLFKKYKSDQT